MERPPLISLGDERPASDGNGDQLVEPQHQGTRAAADEAKAGAISAEERGRIGILGMLHEKRLPGQAIHLREQQAEYAQFPSRRENAREIENALSPDPDTARRRRRR